MISLYPLCLQFSRHGLKEFWFRCLYTFYVFSKEYMVFLWREQTRFPLRSINAPEDSLPMTPPVILAESFLSVSGELCINSIRNSWIHLGPAFSFSDSFLWLLGSLLRVLRCLRYRDALHFFFQIKPLKRQKLVHLYLYEVNGRLILE